MKLVTDENIENKRQYLLFNNYHKLQDNQRLHKPLYSSVKIEDTDLPCSLGPIGSQNQYLNVINSIYNGISEMPLNNLHIHQMAPVWFCWSYLSMVKNPCCPVPDSDHLRKEPSNGNTPSRITNQVNQSSSFWVTCTDQQAGPKSITSTLIPWMARKMVDLLGEETVLLWSVIVRVRPSHRLVRVHI